MNARELFEVMANPQGEALDAIKSGGFVTVEITGITLNVGRSDSLAAALLLELEKRGVTMRDMVPALQGAIWWVCFLNAVFSGNNHPARIALLPKEETQE